MIESESITKLFITFTLPKKLITMSVPSIPTTFTHRLQPTAPFDVDLDTNLNGSFESKLAGGFDVQHSGSLAAAISGELKTDNVLMLKGDAKQPVFTDSKFEIVNLPRFTLDDIKGFMKQRVRIPNYSTVCFKVMGFELFNICMSGESQIITEPYVPTSAENCEDNCCDADTRPFPTIKEN